MTPQSRAPVDQIANIEFAAVFLVFVGIVLLSGLVYAWRYRRMERQRRQGLSAKRKEKRAVDVAVVLSAIEDLGTVDERKTGLRVDLQGEPPSPSPATGLVAIPAPPTEEARQRGPSTRPLMGPPSLRDLDAGVVERPGMKMTSISSTVSDIGSTDGGPHGVGTGLGEPPLRNWQ